MRSSLCARGKDSAGAAYFLSLLASAPVAQSSEIRAATGAASYKRLSLRETCRQFVEQTGDSAVCRHRNRAENVFRAELGMLAAETKSSRISPFA
jgi:hypothetical protein